MLLAIQAGNGTNDSKDRLDANLEFEQLLESIDEISKTAQFNSTPLLELKKSRPIR
ncbi:MULTISPECIES: flagellin N-terminal helical domain-containing protein [Paenibacillus]|uniref:flagellin N-terminal helical domain-containing protein n=1 Tax=Paenibacillus TaxID=44249 RepID=UPI002E1C92AD|nr:hypothetical protein [Paenibacillus macerans]